MGNRVLFYIVRVLVGFDQLLNCILGGAPDHTISGRVGYQSLVTEKWYWVGLESVINFLWFWAPNHCANSIEWDEVGKTRKDEING